jgi:cell fate (sporulation/competence/biofilm development) regulator YlbF (YheA/YmcA/DUF963 family)
MNTQSIYDGVRDRQNLRSLYESEMDLQTLLSDLTDEIMTREHQIVEVQAQLRRVRAEMRRLLHDTNVGAIAS